MFSILMMTVSAQAQDVAVLKGDSCDRRNNCTEMTVELHTDGTVLTSDGLDGTYALVEVRSGRNLVVDIGGLVGTLPEGPQNCWGAASSPLNGGIGSVNLCLTTTLQELKHYYGLCDFVPLGAVFPLNGEDGHWAAGRLTPEQPGGMWINTVTYGLNTFGAGGCSPLDHRIQVFIGPANGLPPANPAVLYEFNVVGAAQPVGDSMNTLELPAPVFVGANESLYVSMEQAYVMESTRTCMGVCFQGGMQGDLSYWSNSDTTPYPWQDLNDFGITEVMVSGHGIYAAP